MRLLPTIAQILLVIAVTMLAATGAHAQYEPPPSLTVTPPTPAPGDPITVEIANCDPNASKEVSIDGVVVGIAITDDDGNFTGEFFVPEGAGGTSGGDVLVEVECGGDVLSSIINVGSPDQPSVQPTPDPDTGPA